MPLGSEVSSPHPAEMFKEPSGGSGSEVHQSPEVESLLSQAAMAEGAGDTETANALRQKAAAEQPLGKPLNVAGETPGEIHGGTPMDPLVETHNVHTDNLQPSPTAEGMDLGSPDVPVSNVEPTVTHIDVVEHPGEGSDEEPSATQSMGNPPDGQQASGTSFMDKMTDHEPTAGPEVPEGAQTEEAKTQAKDAPQVSGENYVHDERKAVVMAHAEAPFRDESINETEAGRLSLDENRYSAADHHFTEADHNYNFAVSAGEEAGNKFDLEHGKVSRELLLSRQKELFEQVGMHSEMMKEAVTELKDITQKLAGKEDATLPEVPNAA